MNAGDESSDKALRVTLHSNTAEALLRMQQWARSAEQARIALRLDPGHEKSARRLKAATTAGGGTTATGAGRSCKAQPQPQEKLTKKGGKGSKGKKKMMKKKNR